GRRSKKSISFSTSAARRQYIFLAVVIDFANNLTGICVFGHGSERHFQDDILTARARAVLLFAGLSGFGDHVLPVFQVQQCPELCISAQPDITAFSPIAAVGTAQGYVLFASEVPKAGASSARTRMKFYVVNKV